MADVAARIAAATATGDVQGLSALAIELVQENSRLAGHAAALEEAEAARKAKQNARASRHRHVVSRDVTLQSVTERDVTLQPPSPPSPSLLPPTPPNNSSPTPSSPEQPPRGAKQPAPWLGRFGAAWHERYDGDMPSGPAVGPLRKLIRQHGEEETFRRWGIYLAATEGRFAAVAKFAATWGDWEAPPIVVSRGGGVQINTPQQARAAALWERYKAANLLTKWERPEYDRIGATLVEAGHYATIADFLDELRVTKPWTLRDARTDGWAVNEIAARMAAPQKAAS